MSPRTGRPPSDNPKRNNTRIRMSDDEVEMLEYCCKVTGLSKADIIRQGIKVIYDRVRTKE